MIALTLPQREVIRSLCHEYKVMKLELFGSATRADFDPQHSDIDVLVEFVPGTDLGPWMGRFFDLQRRLEAILQCKVDLVVGNGLRNPYFIRAINQDRHVLYAA
ncbi:MAG: nucleotidyltransferase domain-containing protein [Herpetosiphonaceae bacterium]|nr:nucleotidyltransferase domain-containing protein [Herpetosiphonaceae bacterium]